MSRHEDTYRSKLLHDDGASLVEDGMLVYANGATGFPNRFVAALARRAGSLRGVRLFHPMRREVLPLRPDPCAPELADHLFHVSDFTYDDPVRDAIRQGRAAYRPIHASESGRRFPYEIDLLVAGAAPMDAHGFFNFGAFGGWVQDFLPRARRVVLEVNPRQPRVFGDNDIHVDRIAGIVEADDPLIELPQAGAQPSAIEQRIAAHVAALVEDGATLQVGAGSLPEAVVNLLRTGGAKDLGVHTEAYFDWVHVLYEAGIVTNARKRLDRER